MKGKAKKLEDHIKTWYGDDDLNRRLKAYNYSNSINNYHDPSKPIPVVRFFQENKEVKREIEGEIKKDQYYTEIFEIDGNNQEMEIFEAMRIYIERHGRPYNYLPSMDHLHIDRMARLENAETDARKNAEIDERLKQEAKEKEISRLEKLAQARMKGISEHVKEERAA